MFDENPSEFLDVERGFAVLAIYDGSAVIAGFFDNAYAEAPLGQAGVGGTRPQFLCPSADVDDDPADKTLVIGDTSWTIVRGESDGTGWTLLELRAA